MTLRLYQSAALDAIRAHLRAGVRRVLLVSPTGSGKTTIAAALIHAAEVRRSRSVFLAHRKELIDQCSARLDSLGVQHGIVMAKHRRYRPLELTQVASVQTLARRELPPAEIVIVDEAHHARAGTYGKILDAYPHAAIVGLTATPWRQDGRGLGELFRAIVVAATPVQLLADGYLVPLDGFAYDNPDLSDVPISHGEYAEGALGAAVDRPKILGNIVEKYQAQAGGSRAVVFAATVKHSLHLLERFRGAGIAAEHLDGTTSRLEREAILARLASGQARVVCNVGVLTEGFDCPALTTCILARPTRSLTLMLQMIGRVLRPVCLDCGSAQDPRADSCTACLGGNIKRAARLHDHAGCVMLHGLPYAEREYSLSMDARRPESTAPPVRQCKECFALYDPRTSRVCPQCGAAPVAGERADGPEEIGGEALSLEDAEAALLERRMRYGIGRFTAYKDLIARANTEGYSAGWAAHQYKARYGEWPPWAWQRQLTPARARGAQQP